MKINIRSKIKITDAIKDYLEHRLHFALSRFGESVRHVAIRISDLNGPKGGVDMQCKILVTLSDGRQLALKEDREDLYVAIDRIMERTGRSVTRSLDRSKSNERF